MRRSAALALMVIMLVTAVPGVATAWCNGPTKNGSKGSGYGSHDWILDRAIKHAGADGAWVIKKTALLASDDPDSANWAAATQHFFEKDSCRGAAQTVADLYHKAAVAYRAGDRAAASKYIGQLSHCFTDILQPFHSTSKAKNYSSLHKTYEFAVDDHQNTPTKSASWVTLRPVAVIADIRQTTVDAAIYARSQFPTLLSALKSSHSIKGNTLRVTKRVMTRGVNDLSDIIASIPQGVGETTAAANIDVTALNPSPNPNDNVGVAVTITGPEGQPLDGVGVRFVWHMPGGDKKWTNYTSATGYCTRYMNIGSVPIGKAISFEAIVTVNGVTTTTQRTFTPVRQR